LQLLAISIHGLAHVFSENGLVKVVKQF